MTGSIAVFFEMIAAVGGAVVLGLMTFAFFPRIVAITVAVIAFALLAQYFVGFLRDYTVLLGSLTSYGVSTTVCILMSAFSKHQFDFKLLAKRVTAFE